MLALIMKRRFRKKLVATVVFSVVATVMMIVHGLFFDLDYSQIGRLSVEGFLFTFVLVFVGLIILEKIFNIEEDAEIVGLKKRVGKLERKK